MGPRLLCAVAGLAFDLALATYPALAQSSGETTPFAGTPIRDVRIVVADSPADATVVTNAERAVRRAFNLFPGGRFDPFVSDAAIAKVRQLPQIASADYELAPANAGISIVVTVRLRAAIATALAGASGVLVDGNHFPTLYVDNASLLRIKLQGATWYQEDVNAWYGQPKTLLAGNPLANFPAGAGWSGWGESYVSAGLYGITPLLRGTSTSMYGGYSYIVSASAGQEIFTNASRLYGGTPDDAYVGIVGGGTDSSGNRLVVNASYGREHFEIGTGMLLRLSSANGDNRAALQLNARNGANRVALVQARYNDVRVDAFYEQPDELAIINSRTSILGLNLDVGIGRPLTLGATYVSAPESQYSYYTPTGTVLPRAGLRAVDVRAAYLPPVTRDGALASLEYAVETNRNFPMHAVAGYAEAGWQWPTARWQPTVTARYAAFSGDDPNTGTFERWDTLYTGGTLQQWVLGANHYKTFQTSNIIAQGLQAIVNPSRKVQFVGQFWSFRAPQLNNLGGPQNLSTYASPDLGVEGNVTVKYFISRVYYAQGGIAYTTPGAAVNAAAGMPSSPWLSASGFVRFSL